MAAGTVDTSLEFARDRDRADPLAGFRERFELPGDPDDPSVYLCGHSLGLMPRAVRTLLERELDRWSRLGVDGHFGDDGGWYAYHERFAEPLAALCGAGARSVVAMNSLTVNLHLLMISLFRPAGARRRILIERSAFPSDRYAVQSQLRLHGLDPATDLIALDPNAASGMLEAADLDRALEAERGDVALVLLPGVQFLTGQALPLEELAAVAHRHGACIGFDLAHAIGNVPIGLDQADADFAVWCSYKYLNAGPGAIGGAYVNERWHEAALPRLEGWWGHDKQRRFALDDDFHGIGTAESWQLSNPPIFAMVPLAASLELFLEAGIAALRSKSVALTEYLDSLLEALCADRATVLSPRNPDARGCQLSVRFALGDLPAPAFVERLAAQKIVVDWRAPDILRLAPVPLYNRFEDVHRAVTAIRRALDR